jgi:hypothetical protein
MKLLPTDAAARKEYPIVTGLLDYFPSALLEVAHVSYIGNQQHNPGQPLHHARGKSTDQLDAMGRHLMERSASSDSNATFKLAKDEKGMYTMAQAIWRLLAEFQIALEAEGAPLARGARLPETEKK